MTRGSKALMVMVVTICGLWGCARGPAGGVAAQAERLSALEAKCAKFEEDYRSVAMARDQAKKAVVALEREKTQFLKELALQQEVIKERDELRKQIESRTNERDLLQARCDRMKKGIQHLLGQDDAMAATTTKDSSLSTNPVVPTATSARENRVSIGGKL